MSQVEVNRGEKRKSTYIEANNNKDSLNKSETNEAKQTEKAIPYSNEFTAKAVGAKHYDENADCHEKKQQRTNDWFHLFLINSQSNANY